MPAEYRWGSRWVCVPNGQTVPLCWAASGQVSNFQLVGGGLFRILDTLDHLEPRVGSILIVHESGNGQIPTAFALTGEMRVLG